MPSYQCKTCQRVTITDYPVLSLPQCPHCGAKSTMNRRRLGYTSYKSNPESARWWRLT